MQTWAALAIWFRFLLYLKTVHPYNWLVHMITACIKDMVPFFVIFMIGVLAFSDAFQSIETGLVIYGLLPAPDMPENPNWYEKYVQGYVRAWQKSYLTALGEFDDSLGHYREGDWFIFFICTIFNIVLLLNLLIAIISETFARVASEQVETTYNEKVSQMCKMMDTAYGLRSEKKSPVEMIFIAKVIQSSDSERTVEERLNAIEKLAEENTTVILLEKMKELINEQFEARGLHLKKEGDDESDNSDSGAKKERKDALPQIRPPKISRTGTIYENSSKADNEKKRP